MLLLVYLKIYFWTTQTTMEQVLFEEDNQGLHVGFHCEVGIIVDQGPQPQILVLLLRLLDFIWSRPLFLTIYIVIFVFNCSKNIYLSLLI